MLSKFGPIALLLLLTGRTRDEKLFDSQLYWKSYSYKLFQVYPVDYIYSVTTIFEKSLHRITQLYTAIQYYFPYCRYIVLKLSALLWCGHCCQVSWPDAEPELPWPLTTGQCDQWPECCYRTAAATPRHRVTETPTQALIIRCGSWRLVQPINSFIKSDIFLIVMHVCSLSCCLRLQTGGEITNCR